MQFNTRKCSVGCVNGKDWFHRQCQQQSSCAIWKYTSDGGVNLKVPACIEYVTVRGICLHDNCTKLFFAESQWRGRILKNKKKILNRACRGGHEQNTLNACNLWNVALIQRWSSSCWSLACHSNQIINFFKIGRGTLIHCCFAGTALTLDQACQVGTAKH